MKWSLSIVILGIQLCASTEQFLDLLSMAPPHCYIKWSPSLFILGIQLGASAEELFNFLCTTQPGCHVQQRRPWLGYGLSWALWMLMFISSSDGIVKIRCKGQQSRKSLFVVLLTHHH